MIPDINKLSFSGHYGAVYRAALIENARLSTSKRMIVTVKTMQKQSEKEWTSLLQTFSILKKKSNHPNVVNLLGVVPDSKLKKNCFFPLINFCMQTIGSSWNIQFWVT